MPTLRLRNDTDTIIAISPYPAAGKGTVIQPLKAELQKQGGVGHIEVGGIVRSHKQEQTLIGQAAAQYEARGLMVPDDVMVPEIRRNMRLLLPQDVWLIDGYPRTGSQVGGYDQIVQELERKDRFVYLNVPRDVAEERMVKRGEKAISEGKTPRADDVDPEARKNRLDGAERDMAPVLEYASGRGNLIEIDGTKTPDEVREAVWRALFEHAPSLAEHHSGDWDPRARAGHLRTSVTHH